MAILLPTLLIGTCGNPTMICNLLMRPALLASGIVAMAASAGLFFVARRAGTAGRADGCRMSLLQLAWKNIAGNGLRSWVVALCALVVAAFALFATLLLRGAATSLELAADRLGADIVVVPRGRRDQDGRRVADGRPGAVLDAEGERGETG